MKESGLMSVDEKRGDERQVLEPCDFSNHGCEQPGNWLWGKGDGGWKAQISELTGDEGV